MKLRERANIILNGRIKSDKVLENGSSCEEDLEYEFLYSVSDDENGDHYCYKFDAYPALRRPSDQKAAGDHGPSRSCGSSNSSQNGSKKDKILDGKYKELGLSVKRERSKSAIFTRSHDQESRKLRAKSASLTTDTKPESITRMSKNSMKGRKPSSVITKEVAFRDTNSACSGVPSSSKQLAGKKATSYDRRKSVSYDPDLEKASAYIHGSGKNFSRSNTSLSPVKYGLKHLQMNYTETNLETNQTVIFLDLLKSSHQRNHLRSEQIRQIEHRLETKRNNPLYSTSFYEHKNIPDPFQRNKKKTKRTVAQKKIERKEKIKQMTDEIHTGYIPTQLTMKIAAMEEIDEIGKTCRYLRCQTPKE